MIGLHLAVIGATIFVNAGAAAGDIAKADFVVKTSQEVGVPLSYVPLLAALKAAGAIGLLAGLLGVPIIGTAAAAGLVAFFVGAMFAHVRARVFYNIAFPAFFLALAVTSLIMNVR
jgi:hypothetical protein